MPLILAIEPDRRQASQLKKLVHSVGAELVLAETTERALDAIGNRIPDLVLVPALLSPQDDAALAIGKMGKVPQGLETLAGLQRTAPRPAADAER